MYIEDILRKIDRLDMSHQVINSIKTNLVDDKVIRLDLGNLDLLTLPSGIFDQISTLNVLYLNNNQLSLLPIGIFDCLPLLQWLDLGRNRLEAIQENTFSKSSSLRVLGLHNNQLT